MIEILMGTIEILKQISLGLLSSNFFTGISLLISTLTLLVLAITLFYVKEYTKITSELQRTAEKQQEAAETQTDELIKQRRLSIMPSLLHSIEVPPKGKKAKLYIKNIGYGIALNVSIEDFSIKEVFNSYSKTILFEFNTIDLIKKDEKVQVNYSTHRKIKKGPVPSVTTKNINTHSNLLKKDYEHSENILKFIFQDIEGYKYKQINRYGKGEYHHGTVELLKTDTN